MTPSPATRDPRPPTSSWSSGIEHSRLPAGPAGRRDTPPQGRDLLPQHPSDDVASSNTRRSIASPTSSSPSCRSRCWGSRCGWLGRHAALAGPRRAGHQLHPDGPRDHGRLPPPVHAPQLQDQPAAARAVRRARVGGRRGPGDRVGLDPPQASPLQRPARATPTARTSITASAGAARSAGLFHAHVGWMFRGVDRANPERYAKDLLADPVLRFVDRTFPLWVLLGLAVPVRPRSRAHRHGRRRPDGPAVGRRGAHVLPAPRDLLDQLAVPLLRPAPLQHRRRVAQPRVARAADLRRGLAQQPPRVPHLRAPRPPPLAARPRRLADRRTGLAIGDLARRAGEAHLAGRARPAATV